MALIIACVLISSCSVKPKPLTNEEVKNYLYKDRIGTYSNTKKLDKPLTLYDAIARAIKYNKRYKEKVKEAAIGLIETNAMTMDMLPDLVANVNYVNLSNDRALSSPATGQTSTARNRDTVYSNLNLSWNILDFGISYFSSKQLANEYLSLQEKKRILLQEVVRDTRTAYWASHISDIIVPQVKDLSKELDSIIEKSKQQEQDKLIDRTKAASYRIDLWKSSEEINAMVANLERASHAFSALINVPTYMQIDLDQNYEYKILKHHLPYDIRELELLALHNRPEIRQEILKNKIDIDEIYKKMLNMVPNFMTVIGGNYDSTTYLVDQFWREVSLQVTWNMFKLFRNYYQLETAKGIEELGHLKRQALAISILTQINVSYVRLLEAEKNHKIVRGLYNDNLVLYKNMKDRKDVDLASNLDYMKSKIAFVAAKFKLLSSHYDRINAYNELLDAVGYNSISKVTDLNQPIDKISKQIELSFNSKDGFKIPFSEIKTKYRGQEVLNSFGRKKLIDELDPDDGIDPQILRQEKELTIKVKSTKKIAKNIIKNNMPQDSKKSKNINHSKVLDKFYRYDLNSIFVTMQEKAYDKLESKNN